MKWLDKILSQGETLPLITAFLGAIVIVLRLIGPGIAFRLGGAR